MNIRLSWDDINQNVATAHLMDSSGREFRQYYVANVQEFINEYYFEKSRPVPPSPYLTEASYIATLNYYLKQVDDALKESDDATKLSKVQEIMTDFNTPKAVA